ncbi:MAG: GldG family protein [Acutalibacter sp.]|nr:GldG family protein [Acutalibacter sp.]
MDNRNDENRMEQENLQQEIAESKAEAEEAVKERDEAAEEIKEAKAETNKKAETLLNGKPLNGKKKGFNSAKWKRGGMATALSVMFIAIIVVINILVGLLTDRFPSLNMDLTAQKLNTLSDQAVKIAKGVQQDTTIYLIGSEDGYRNDSIYASYGLEYSQVVNLAERLREVNSKISVEFVDPDTNPTFISAYPDDSLTTGKVLVETERRHKVLGVSDLFTVTQNSTTYAVETYSKVDSALASALEVVNLDKVPVIAIATGHGEMLGADSMGNFLSLLETQNYEVEEVDFLTEEIPENTQIVMIPTPTTDYTDEEISKLREYIDDVTRPERIALLVTCHPTQGALPKLTAFLEEWGIRVEEGMVAETDVSRVALRNASYVLVDHTEELLNDNDYDYLVSPASRPITRLFDGNGDVVKTASLWTTSGTAYVATEDMAETDPADIPKSSQTVAAISEKRPKVDGKNTARDVIVFGSSYVFLDQFMTSSFGDRNYISDVMNYCTGMDDSQVTVMTHQVQTNVLDVTASSGTVNLLGLGVFTIGLPLVILVIGLVVFLKRRHL